MGEKLKGEVENCENCDVIPIPKAFCCFLDVLGYTSLKACEQRKLAQEICCVYRKLELEKDKNVTKRSFTFRVFSDNIVVIQALTKDIDNYICELAMELGKFIEKIGRLYEHLIRNTDLLLRGGVSLGEILENDYVIGGQALIEAFNIEHKEAKYPLVMISSNIVENFFQGGQFLQSSKCFELLKKYLIGIDKKRGKVIPLTCNYKNAGDIESINFYISPKPFLKEETKTILKHKCNNFLEGNYSPEVKGKYKMLLQILNT